MSECTGSIDSVKRVKLILNDDELDPQGLPSLLPADRQAGAAVIQRWELLQAQTLSDQRSIQHDLQQWQRLTSDLRDVTSWLGTVLSELEGLRRLAPSTRVRDMEENIQKLKVVFPPGLFRERNPQHKRNFVRLKSVNVDVAHETDRPPVGEAVVEAGHPAEHLQAVRVQLLQLVLDQHGVQTKS